MVTPDEMRAIDAAAPEPVDELVRRAGAAVARAAIEMLGGGYGRVVDVIAGPGNNGADGRDAARRLRSRGVTVREFDAADCPPDLAGADLVIDAAFGTGYHPDPDRPWRAPSVGATPVLAVDVPSGIDALTGAADDGVLRADRTVTFQAFKPGLLFGRGASLAGRVDVVDIGLDTAHIRCHVVEESDVAAWWPVRPVDAHKWKGAVEVIAGSPAMPGAAELCTAAAARGGSGLVSLSAPGCRPDTRSEIVQRPIPTADFCASALADVERFGALVIGPGLGREPATIAATRDCIASAPVPTVVDGDALFAAADRDGALLRDRVEATIVTPHDGEFEQLTGAAPGADRIATVRAAAGDLGVTVLLKGPTTVIAEPGSSTDGPARVLLVDRGDQRLATAGSGDVLAGLVGAAIANGAGLLRGAAAAAWIHGAAADLGPASGLLAGDLVDLIPVAVASLRAGAPPSSGSSLR